MPNKGRATSPLPPVRNDATRAMLPKWSMPAVAAEACRNSETLLLSAGAGAGCPPAAGPNPKEPSNKAEQQQREAKRKQLVNHVGRDRTPHQQRKLPPQEALHQPVPPRKRSMRCTTTHCDTRIEDRGTEDFPMSSGKKLYGELTMMSSSPSTTMAACWTPEVVEDFRQQPAGPARRSHCTSAGPFGHLHRGHARARRTRFWWFRASSSRGELEALQAPG